MVGQFVKLIQGTWAIIIEVLEITVNGRKLVRIDNGEEIIIYQDRSGNYREHSNGRAGIYNS